MTAFQTLQALRLQYPTPMSREQNGALLNAVAWAHRGEGFGLYRKVVGNNCPMLNGTLISRDILYNHVTGIGYDCLRDSEGEAQPVWEEAHELQPQNWTAPIAPVAEPEPVPEPTPIPPTPQPPTDFAPVLERIDALEEVVTGGMAVLLQRMDALSAQLNEERKITARLSGILGGNISGTITKG